MVNSQLTDIFTDEKTVKKIKERLPVFFQIAEIESSRAGKIGMEVGSVREQILIGLLIHKFGEKNVKTDIPITEAEKDVEVLGKPISIKTLKGLGNVKACWTVDTAQALKFYNSYKPSCDILLAIIDWENKDSAKSGLFLMPRGVQEEIMKKLGREEYLKLPKEGTNPRGVEFSKRAIIEMIESKNTCHIEISWKKEIKEYKSYKRWLEMWED